MQMHHQAHFCCGMLWGHALQSMPLILLSHASHRKSSPIEPYVLGTACVGDCLTKLLYSTNPVACVYTHDACDTPVTWSAGSM